jgi:hypothetical protein
MLTRMTFPINCLAERPIRFPSSFPPRIKTMTSTETVYNIVLMTLAYPLNTPVPQTWVGNALYTCPGDDAVLALLGLHAAMNSLYDRFEPENRRRIQMKDAEAAAYHLGVSGPAVGYAICGRFKKGEAGRHMNRLFWTEKVEIIQRSDGGVSAAQVASSVFD